MVLRELIEEETVKIPLSATDKSGVIRELVSFLQGKGSLEDIETVIGAVEAREALFSTGLDRGIAMPHAKTTAVKSPVLALGISPQGVEFDALDGEPSKIFFLILVPPEEAGTHVQLLSEIAQATQSSDLLASLVSATSAIEVVSLFN